MLVGMKIHLTSEQRIALEILHKNSRDWPVRDRIRCVLLAADGWTAAMITKSQLIDETTVRRHLYEWFNEEKLKPENVGSDSHLNEV
jgi:predicted ArsR family transcriptional regulator